MEIIVLIFFYIISPFLLLTTLVTISNLLSAPRLERASSDDDRLVSICVPARNEEHKIPHLMESILNQDYKKFEVILLDDGSQDKTLDAALRYANKNKRIKVINGKPLPPGWTGKNWACHQLSKIAEGEIIIFVDADCRLSPYAVSTSLCYLKKYSLSLLSVFPGQIIDSFGEKLVVPLMNWILLSLLPLRMVYISSRESLAAANGQFMVFTKKAYDSIGGHLEIADKIVDDMELARRIKKNKFKMMTALDSRVISCKMYNSYDEARLGFSKNFYPGFNTRSLVFIIIILFLFVSYTLPFLLVIYYPIFTIHIAVILLQRLFVSLLSKQNLIVNLLLHPVQMLIMANIGIQSVYKSKKGKLIWKGRSLSKI
ncbi:MAG: glycosyltransferase [Spirochaetota bacterium]|nr:glycosyltransferase [Spirochaetota bacterium]